MVKPLSDWSLARRVRYRVRSWLPGGAKATGKLVAAETADAFNRAVARAAGKVCVDLGANVGKVTQQMAATAGRVYAFEPDPWTVDQLRSNVAGLDNVTVIPAAAGVCDGTVPFYRNPDFASDPAPLSVSSSVLTLNANLDATRPLHVEQVDFVRWLSEQWGSGVSVLKIDIEGAEVELLEALFARPDLLDRLDYIFAETHEWFIPSHAGRVARLRSHARQIQRPVINLDWH